ncbi:porin [Vibrio aphrogenes]|uniref:porin n=1 Tax=Vibrio aphrogenes TaxID=1891186 RepID=UPI000B354485|nr:porin [Vibrio aphrogenes]
MEKIFKRTLLGAAISTVALAGTANAAIPLAGDAVQFYGQAAGYMLFADDQDDSNFGVDLESRIGFRGTVEFEDFAPNLIWQIEGGNANNGDKSGQLGARDTYLGLDFDGFGSIKYGRQLVATYNYVDWPHSNPGLGNVFDWNNDIGAGFQDRADHVVRYDSANWGGFSFQATVSGMENTVDALVASVAASYSADMFNVHAGYYNRGDYDSTGPNGENQYIIDPNTGEVVLNPNYDPNGAKVKVYGNNYAIVGGSLFLGDVTFTAAYKYMEQDSAAGTNSQNAWSTTAQYVLNNKWVFKVGYAGTDDADMADGTGQDTADTALTARLGYLLPSTYLYIDSRNYDMNNSGDWNNFVLVGAEYYF